MRSVGPALPNIMVDDAPSIKERKAAAKDAARRFTAAIPAPAAPPAAAPPAAATPAADPPPDDHNGNDELLFYHGERACLDGIDGVLRLNDNDSDQRRLVFVCSRRVRCAEDVARSCGGVPLSLQEARAAWFAATIEPDDVVVFPGGALGTVEQEVPGQRPGVFEVLWVGSSGRYTTTARATDLRRYHPYFFKAACSGDTLWKVVPTTPEKERTKQNAMAERVRLWRLHEAHRERVAEVRQEKARKAATAQRQPFMAWLDKLREQRRRSPRDYRGLMPLDEFPLLMLSVCAGPFQSDATAVHHCFPRGRVCTLDWSPNALPDICMDFCRFDIDKFIAACGGRKLDMCFFAPNCKSWSCQACFLGSRSAENPAGDPSIPETRAANDLADAIAALIWRGIKEDWFTVFGVENPWGSRFWLYPAIRALYDGPAAPMRLLRADYCEAGRHQMKPGGFLVSKDLDWRPRLCSGLCAGRVRGASGVVEALHVNHHGGYNLSDAAIPHILCVGWADAAWRLLLQRRANGGGRSIVARESSEGLEELLPLDGDDVEAWYNARLADVAAASLSSDRSAAKKLCRSQHCLTCGVHWADYSRVFPFNLMSRLGKPAWAEWVYCKSCKGWICGGDARGGLASRHLALCAARKRLADAKTGSVGKQKKKRARSSSASAASSKGKKTTTTATTPPAKAPRVSSKSAKKAHKSEAAKTLDEGPIADNEPSKKKPNFLLDRTSTSSSSGTLLLPMDPPPHTASADGPAFVSSSKLTSSTVEIETKMGGRVRYAVARPARGTVYYVFVSAKPKGFAGWLEARLVTSIRIGKQGHVYEDGTRAAFSISTDLVAWFRARMGVLCSWKVSATTLDEDAVAARGGGGV